MSASAAMAMLQQASPRTVASLRPSLQKRQKEAALPAAPSSTAADIPDITIEPYFTAPPETFRGDRGVNVFEFGARQIRAGFSGGWDPLCTHFYHPNKERRVGDFREWMPGYKEAWRAREGNREWGWGREGWSVELGEGKERTEGLKLVGDRIERALRELYTTHLLTPSTFDRRFIFVLPPHLSLPLILLLLSRFFHTYEAKTITLYPSPILDVVAAGLRSGLVIDIGWTETVVSAIYEHREIRVRRSVRGTKWLAKETGRMLCRRCREQREWHSEADAEDDEDEDAFMREISFDEVEDVMCRVVWCRPFQTFPSPGRAPESKSSQIDDNPPEKTITDEDDEENPIFDIPLKSTTPPLILNLRFSALSNPTESTFFPSSYSHPDDHELPIIDLIHSLLTSLPQDIRGHLVARTIFAGGGSRTPGLKPRILKELQALIDRRGWDPVRGKAHDELSRRIDEANAAKKTRLPIRPRAEPQTPGQEPVTEDPTAQPADPVLVVTSKERAKIQAPHPWPTPGKVRAVDSMGAWTGASLLGNLKITGAVTVERERFLAGGIGAVGLNGETVEKEKEKVKKVGGKGKDEKDKGEKGWSLGGYWM
ncbi:MAG: hypothetical protein M1814_002183 [Vezdaea aestivalis]|nr:MAG: hypothetical protein M1814_002183 [Vezdaea aestivalis]